MKNKCELFLKETWYQEEAIKNFKLNYIKRNIKDLDYYIKNIYSEEESNYYEKSEYKIEEEYVNKKSDDDPKQDINNNNENSNDIDNNIGIEEYKNKSNIIKVFFNSFPIKLKRNILKIDKF